MSSTAVSTPAPTTPVFKESVLARLIAAFSGPVGLVTKIVILSIVNAIGIWAIVVLGTKHNWIAAAVVVAVTAVIDLLYFVRKAVPAKFLIPGTFFLVCFQVIPVAYTIDVAFTNYSTGHILSKGAAIAQIKEVTLAQTGNGRTYTMAVAHDSSGRLVLLLSDDQTKATYVGTSKSLTPVPKTTFTRASDGSITSAKGYHVLTAAQVSNVAVATQLQNLVVPAGGDKGIRAEGLQTAAELQPTMHYDAKRDVFVRLSDHAVFHDNGQGTFVHGSGKAQEQLLPGWKADVGFLNFSRMIHNPLVRAPFIRVFVWTFIFATLTVLLSFSIGLFLAIALNKPGMRGRWVYRSAIILPYAIPGFLSLLVWRGLLNDDFGVVNSLLGHIGLHEPWLFDPNWARVSVILVSVWLTTPYFFLISLGALQSIPAELIEAARVDGATAWQSFRKVTLPLLLVAVAPLMIASFAFNFNNFGNIYLLTGGGPALNDNTIAGATDILISYTYKIAFAAGLGQDYGLASAFSIVIFFLVATISAVSFWRTRSLENLA
jgi:arabinogalactan oligomer/maltooligosaccharide transport system permease protein